MLYFKYDTSFKKGKSLEKLIINQGIDRIYNEEEFNKNFAKGIDIYCFIDPFSAEIDNEIVLNWGLSEGEAWDLYYDSADDI